MSTLVRDYEERRENSNGHFTMMLTKPDPQNGVHVPEHIKYIIFPRKRASCVL